MNRGRHLGATVLLAAGLLAVGCSTKRAVFPGPLSAPGTIRPSVAYGDRLRRSGREEEALGFYACAIQGDPSSIPAHLRYVGTLSELGRRSEARQAYAERAARPGASNADLTMSQRLATDGSSSALRRVYALASEREPSSAWWRLAQVEIEIAEAQAWNDRRHEAVETGDREAERDAHATAHAALRRGAEYLERAYLADPSLAEVKLYRGSLRAVEGDLQSGAAARAAAYRAAAAAFGEAAESDPDLVEAWEGLGDVRFRLGDLRESLLAFLAAARRVPADPHLRVSIGVVLQRIGRHGDAAEQFAQAAVLRPDDADPWLRLGDARVEEERWDDGLRAYDEALKRDASVVVAHYKKATVYEHLERFGEARVSYETYLSQGGEKAGLVRRRVERLLRDEGKRRQPARAEPAGPAASLPPPVIR